MQKPSRHSTPFKISLIIIAIIVVISTVFYSFALYNQIAASNKQEKMNNEALLQIKKDQAAKEALKKQPVPIQLPNAQPITAIVQDYSQADSLWTLVNKTHSISTDYIPANLVIPDVAERNDKSTEERSVRQDVAGPLKTMFDAATEDGHSLMIGSAYRSAVLQKTYFDSYAAASGIEAANQLSAYPGQSEHQTGLAVDISSVSRSCYLDECFTNTPDGEWLASHAYAYGFTLRYPNDKTAITGYNFEPWHYRYIGIPLATALHESGLTLDEAWPYLITAQNTLVKHGAIKI